MKENDQVLEGINDDSISLDMDKTMVEEMNPQGDDSDEEIIELVDLIEKGPGIEEDLAVALEDLPEKTAGQPEGDIELFSDEELALGDEGNQIASSETADVTHLFEEEKQEVVDKADTGEISESDLTSILEEDVSATVVLDSEPDQPAAETLKSSMDLSTDEAVEKILEPVIEEEEGLEASLEPDFVEEKEVPAQPRVETPVDREPGKVAEPAPELELEEREETVIDLSPDPDHKEDIAAAVEETTVLMGAEDIVGNSERAPMESIEETLDLTKESLTSEEAKPGGEDALVDDLDQFLMEDSDQVKESVDAEEVETISVAEKEIEPEAGEPGDVEEERPQGVFKEEGQGPEEVEMAEEPDTAPAGGILEERLEETVRNVVEEVVERVARETMSSVAEKVITEAIDALKESLEVSSE
jgi:hypothetical protein